MSFVNNQELDGFFPVSYISFSCTTNYFTITAEQFEIEHGDASSLLFGLDLL